MEDLWWRKNGYLAGKKAYVHGLWICLAPMIFTYRVMLCTEDSVLAFACYESPERAREAFDAWDGTGLPLDGYTRTHGVKP